MGNFENRGEAIKPIDKVKGYCKKFGDFNLIESDDGFVAEILDKGN